MYSNRTFITFSDFFVLPFHVFFSNIYDHVPCAGAGRFILVDHSPKGITVISSPSLAGTTGKQRVTVMVAPLGEERRDHGAEKKRRERPTVVTDTEKLKGVCSRGPS